MQYRLIALLTASYVLMGYGRAAVAARLLVMVAVAGTVFLCLTRTVRD
jgi:hypothetical protein